MLPLVEPSRSAVSSNASIITENISMLVVDIKHKYSYIIKYFYSPQIELLSDFGAHPTLHPFNEVGLCVMHFALIIFLHCGEFIARQAVQ